MQPAARADVIPAELTPGARVFTVAGTGGEEPRNGIAAGAPATTVGLGIPNVIAASPDGGFLAVVGCQVVHVAAPKSRDARRLAERLADALAGDRSVGVAVERPNERAAVVVA